MTEHNIVSISKVKNNQLFDFYQKVFKNRYRTLSKFWKWWYRSNYLGFEPLVLIEKNKISKTIHIR